MELFVFVHMQRGVEQIECKLLCPDESVAVARLTRDVGRFDAHACRCFVPQEKVKLLGIIRAAFSDLSSFNSEVKAKLREAMDLSDSESEGSHIGAARRLTRAFSRGAHTC